MDHLLRRLVAGVHLGSFGREKGLLGVVAVTLGHRTAVDPATIAQFANCGRGAEVELVGGYSGTP
jgi:hypothetical protein